MQTRVVVQIALVALASAVQPASGRAGVGKSAMIYGPHHAFRVQAPAGWILDVRSERNNGMPAVLYRRGESWQSGAAVMYVNTVVPDSGAPSPVINIIRTDSARFRDALRGEHIDTAATLHTADGRAAMVRMFHGDSGNVDLVAYVPARTIIAVIVLSARTQVAFDAARSAFESLVGSYRFLSDQVVIRP